MDKNERQAWQEWQRKCIIEDWFEKADDKAKARAAGEEVKDGKKEAIR